MREHARYSDIACHWTVGHGSLRGCLLVDHEQIELVGRFNTWTVFSRQGPGIVTLPIRRDADSSVLANAGERGRTALQVW